MTTSVGYTDDQRCDKHHPNGPEEPERVKTLRSVLESLDLVKLSDRLATEEDLMRVHPHDYINKIKRSCEYLGKRPYQKYAPDVYINASTFDAACAATGSVLTAVDAILPSLDQSIKHVISSDQQLDPSVHQPIKHVFCNVRPPGHHVQTKKPNGFCIFNNVMVGVRYLHSKKPDFKVVVVDWDVHSGDGTDQIIRNGTGPGPVPNLTYYNMFNADIWPNFDKKSDLTKRIHCIPLRSGISRDAYREAFHSRIRVPLDEIKPDVIFVSCGFDSHRNDPLGQMNLLAEDFAYFTEELKQTGANIISVLEGGYSLPDIADCLRAHVNALRVWRA